MNLTLVGGISLHPLHHTNSQMTAVRSSVAFAPGPSGWGTP